MYIGRYAWYCFVFVFCSLSSSLSRDLITKKDPEFRSIFQHIQSAQLRHSPSELFAQHVVSIVHYIKGRVWSEPVSSGIYRFKIKRRQELTRPNGHFITLIWLVCWCGCMRNNVFCSWFAAQHFHSSDMTLSERFAMYQRKAAEVEMRKPRKSPEIHRYP